LCDNEVQSPGVPDHLRACAILPGSGGTDSEKKFSTARAGPDTNGEISVMQENQERSGSPLTCPRNLHENGEELQERNITATTMTALLSTAVQTYDEWTLIHHRNGKGGTKQAPNGPKEHKIGPKEPKVGPKVGNRTMRKTAIGSQLTN
jgi:hypothetical protein